MNWNTREDLERCLDRLCAAPPDAIEAIVVDNGSTDGSADMVRARFPSVLLIRNERNEGYARGCNQCMALARGEAVLLLNPDVRIRPQDVLRLAQFLREKPGAAAVAPRLRLPDETVQRSARSFPHPWALFCESLGLSRLFPRSARFNPYRLGGYDYDETREVDQPMASCLMIRREALGALREGVSIQNLKSKIQNEEEGRGGAQPMDEGFPLFFNDVDLCWRLKAMGGRIYLWPEVEAEHRHAASTRQVPRSALVAESHRSLLRFYHKHYRGRLPWIVYWPTVVLIIMSGWARQAKAKVKSKKAKGLFASHSCLLPFAF